MVSAQTLRSARSLTTLALAFAAVVLVAMVVLRPASDAAGILTHKEAVSKVSDLTALEAPLALVPAAAVLADTVVADLDLAQPAAAEAPGASVSRSQQGTYGRLPRLAPDVNPQVASLVAAADGSHPERRSALVSPAAFDLEKYRADPAAFIQVVAPGRMFQTATPAADVPYLELLSEGALQVEQGQSIVVRARTAPDSPISWHAEGLGAWPNGLAEISVAGGADGEVAVAWTATSGVLGDVTLVGASPTAIGQILVHVEVVLPEAAVNEGDPPTIPSDAAPSATLESSSSTSPRLSP